MCGICGCSDPTNAVTMSDPEHGIEEVLRSDFAAGPIAAHQHAGEAAPDHSHEHAHPHGHDDAAHAHAHAHGLPHSHGPSGEIVSLETAVLAKNDQLAERNRGWFAGRGVLALNLVSSPGAGKTTLLQRTIEATAGELNISVIEGDQMTSNDAERIRAAGARAIQVNTGAGCHLEADMIARALQALDPVPGSVVMIENVGNLVCPAMFDLGEQAKVVVFSTPEGEDKPLKYPHMFRAASTVLINKIDLAPHCDFDEERCRQHIAEVNPNAKVLSLSARTGEGLRPWIDHVLALRG